MSHLSESILRRYVDEPDALLSYEKEHLLGCTSCRARLEQTRDQAAFAAKHLMVDDAVDLENAHRSVLARTPHSEGAHPADFKSHSSRTPLQWSGALAAALVLFLLLGYSPLRIYAQNFLAIFEPHQFEPIGFSSSDITKMKGLPNLKAFGTMHETGSTKFSGFGDNLAAATHFTHTTILRAKYLPAGVPNSAMYHATGQHTLSFKFSTSKVHPVPNSIAGSTISATLGPILVETYGEKASAMRNPKRLGKGIHSDGMHTMPADMIVITQAPAPKVYSTGATIAEIEAWLLAQPGLPPNVAQQIKAIGDPSTTLPVPFQLDKQNAQKINVRNAPGLLIGDNTGVGSLVMWQTSGMVYAVAGPYAASEILQVANSMSQ